MCYDALLIQILDINECNGDPCTEDGAVCTNTVGSYTCTCPEDLYNNGNLCYGMENVQDILKLILLVEGLSLKHFIRYFRRHPKYLS